MPVPVFVKDASERRYVLVNRAAEKFWGVPSDEMIGRTAHELFPKQDADLIAARDDELMESGELHYGEREMRTPRNGVRFASSKRLIISDRNRRPQYLIGVLEDATERRRLEHGQHPVRCLTRRPHALAPRVAHTTEVVAGDLLQPESLAPAMTGVQVAYYLVHSMGSGGDFAS